MTNKESSYIDIYALLAISLQFILQILYAYVLKVDAAGRMPMFFLLTAFLVCIPNMDKSILKGPLAIYFCLAIYLFINGIVQKGYLTYEVSPILQLFRKTMTPPVFLILCSTLLQRRERQTIMVLFISTCFFVAAYCYFKLMGSPSEINENSAALVLISSVVLLCYGHLTKLFNTSVFIAITVLSMIETVIIGSRMSLAVVFFLYSVFALLKLARKKNIIGIVSFVFFAAVLSVFILLSLKYSEVGTRMMETTEQTENFSVSTGTILDKFGDRGLQYYFSWPYFVASPVFGIGLNNWILYNPVDTICHSEYLVQYLENGLVAFIPYVLFLYLLMHSLRKEYRKRKDTSRMGMKFVYLSMYGVLFCNLVIWTNDQYAVFVIYALCYALSRQKHLYRIKQV